MNPLYILLKLSLASFVIIAALSALIDDFSYIILAARSFLSAGDVGALLPLSNLSNPNFTIELSIINILKFTVSIPSNTVPRLPLFRPTYHQR